MSQPTACNKFILSSTFCVRYQCYFQKIYKFKILYGLLLRHQNMIDNSFKLSIRACSISRKCTHSGILKELLIYVVQLRIEQRTII